MKAPNFIIAALPSRGGWGIGCQMLLSVHLVALFLGAALGLSICTPIVVASTTWYVNGVSGSDSNNCKSPTSACKTIKHAISLSSSGDSIMVAAATYKENLTISKSLNVIGSGASTTIVDGGGAGTVVSISSTSAHMNLSKLRIQNGGKVRCGGGVYNVGTLTISSAVISGNQAYAPGGGGICNVGAATVSNSTISGNQAIGSNHLAARGGGILNSGTLTINSSTISGNSVTRGIGAGIDNDFKTLTINSSTISGNSVIVFGVGGGVTNSGGTATTINNSTISGNNGFGSAGGIGGGTATSINNSTIAFNTPDGINYTATLQNSILANNHGANCAPAGVGTVTSNGHNLSSDGSCHFNRAGDMNNTNPVLGPLQHNGGATKTQALLFGSPAIDAGNPSGCTDGSGHVLKTDQRGMPRPDQEDAGGCDMGAYERQSD